MKEIILEIFNLQGLDRGLAKCWVTEGEIYFKLKDSHQASCPRCGVLTDKRHARGRWRKVYHGSAFGRRVWVLLRKSRYLCGSCSKPFTEELSWILPRQRKTVEAEQQIIHSLRGQSFKSVSEKEGISYGVSKRVLKRCLNPEQVRWPESGEIWLGIDAHSFRGAKLVNTVTEVRSRRPLTILPDNRKETVKRFLRNIPAETKERVREVCIDMESMLLAAVEEELPQASVVVDHFHLIQDANVRMDEARRIEQDAVKQEIPRKIFLVGKEKLNPKQKKRVETYCQKYPSLKEFYWMKEALRSLYRLKSKTAAEKRLKDLIQTAFLSDDAAMVQWGRTLKRWSRYILNFFDHRTTNAYTEGIHTKIKMIKRVSFGFRNVQVYVRKVLLCLWPLAFIFPWLPHYSS
jgi:transposase